MTFIEFQVFPGCRANLNLFSIRIILFVKENEAEEILRGIIADCEAKKELNFKFNYAREQIYLLHIFKDQGSI